MQSRPMDSYGRDLLNMVVAFNIMFQSGSNEADNDWKEDGKGNLIKETGDNAQTLRAHSIIIIRMQMSAKQLLSACMKQ